MELIRNTIKKVKIKLNINVFIRCFFTAMIPAIGIALVLQIVAIFLPFYIANLISLIVLAVGLLAAVILTMIRKTTTREAALAIDSFGFNEKITTAVENEAEEDDIFKFQRQDAAKSLKAGVDKIRIKLQLPKKRAIITGVLLVAAVAAFFIPSVAKSKAEEQHLTKQEAKKAVAEIEELEEALEDVDIEELSEEDKEKLQQIMESLEASKKEMSEASTGTELDKAKDKYNYKLQNVSNQLQGLNQGGSQSVSNSIKNAEEIIKNQQTSQNLMAQNDPQGQNGQNGQNGQQGQQGQNGQQDPNGQNGQQDPNGQNGQGGQQGQQGQNGQSGQQGQQGQNGQSGQQDPNGQNGQSGQQGQGGQQGQNGQGGQQGQSGQQGQGGQQGQNGQNGQQGGQQNGNGSAGQGSGQGAGNGTSETEVTHNHDYVSVSQNVTGDYHDNSNSQYAKEQNGMVWNGEAVPYDTVVHDYANSAYEGVEQGKYPDSMSGVIKDYFSGLDD